MIDIIAKSYVDPRTRLPHPPCDRAGDARSEDPIRPVQGRERAAKTILDELGRSSHEVREGQAHSESPRPSTRDRRSGVLKGFGEILKEEWGGTVDCLR